MSDTTERIAAIEARLAQATPGEWRVEVELHGRGKKTTEWYTVGTPGAVVCRTGADYMPRAIEDAALIAAAPADLAFLLAELRETQRAEDEARAETAQAIALLSTHSATRAGQTLTEAIREVMEAKA